MRITAERAREVLDYDPETGVFVWRATLSNRARIGMTAGTVHPNGYRYVSVDGTRNLAHRLAWLYVTGEWPGSLIDHIDTNQQNNAFANLRLATYKMNAENRHRAMPSNKIGLLGVSKGRRGTFKAQIGTNGGNKYLGEFATPEGAHSAYVAAKRCVHAGCTL